ncbi:hypothetical protein ACFC4S_23735 [Priestia megaterium]|uniref:DUF7910 domain-containing protein n=1 Tax=Priestia megaterium TaxID=1404 RepID=UPI0035DF2039
MLIPDIGQTAKVCLQTWMGTYVCAENGGGSIVVVNRPKVGEWETFELNRVDQEHITLKTESGQYLCAEEGGGTIVVANRSEAKEYETFKLFVDQSGLVALQSHNGQFLCAEGSGVLIANRPEAKEWEAFRVLDPSEADQEYTQIEVNVYKIVSAPFWHTGTVIDGKEYYFDTSNQVETTTPQGTSLTHHRKMVRLVPGNLNAVKLKLDTVIGRWNGTRYDLSEHNCNFFTDDLIKSLGAPGLDQEYLRASGLAIGLSSIPGGALTQELLVKWPPNDKRLDSSFMEDLERLADVPNNIKAEILRFDKKHLGGIFSGIEEGLGSIGGIFR